MKKFGQWLLKLLFLPAGWLVMLVPAAAGLLIYAFTDADPIPAVIYLSYFLSAYALTAVSVRIPAIWRRFRSFRRHNRYIRRYNGDAGLRVRLSLYSSLAVNLMYVLMQLGLGFYHRSVWFYTLAGYYGLLAVMRCLLLRAGSGKRSGKRTRLEYKTCCICGVLLVLMNSFLAVIVFYIVWQGQGFSYHPIVTIAIAAYTFYVMTMAIINLIRYHRYKSPVIFAAKLVSFIAALVSMLSLETTMISAFGSDGDEGFRHMMTAVTGGVVCMAVLGLALWMIASSLRGLKTAAASDTIPES